MRCYGRFGLYSTCAECEHRESCAKIHRYDKSVARSNRRYALLKLSCENATALGLGKSAPPSLPEQNINCS